MAKQSYESALSAVLAHEGGYVNHPADPGGETNYGITRRTARAHGYAGSMRSIPMSVVRAIYRKGFWDAMRCDELPVGIDYAVFDFAVNSGTGSPTPFLCRAIGIPERASITQSVIDAAHKADPAAVVRKLCADRLAWLKRRKIWRTFGRGWSRRVAGVETKALSMITAARLLP